MPLPLRVLFFFSLLIGGDACRKTPHVGSTPAPPAAPAWAQPSVSAGAGMEKLLPLYDDQPEHPWNRVHAALYASSYPVQRTPCLLPGKKPGCDVLESPYAAMTALEDGVSEYVETSPIVASKDVRFLTEAPRLQAALSALRAAAELSPLEHPLAAALFQHDLWERFDTLDAALQVPEGELLPDTSSSGDPLRVLRDAVGALMRKLALPKAVIEKLPSNLPALVRSYPELLGGFLEGKWIEVATRSQDRPAPMSSPFKEGTRHAMMAGFRAAFRRFVHVPGNSGGAEWLRQALRDQPGTLKLPLAAQVVIFEHPLVVSSEGEIVPLPIVSLVEARTAKPISDVKVPLQALGFEALETRRALLRAPGFPDGGLERLPFNAPFPLGGTCAPNPGMLLPLRAVCVMCHGPAGDTLTGTLSHGASQLRADSDSDLQVRVTIDAKKARADFAALRALFMVNQ